jgi:uncharacterized RDD family membrane protein YckC
MDFKLKEKNAALWKRFFAYVIDIFIINFIVLFPFKSYYKEMGNFLNTENLISTGFLDQVKVVAPKFFLVSLLVAILTILYWALLEYYLKQSIGKMVLNIRIISTNKILKFWQCFTRNISKCSLLILIIDFIFVFFNKNNQRLFERISNTKVVERSLQL